MLRLKGSVGANNDADKSRKEKRYFDDLSKEFCFV